MMENLDREHLEKEFAQFLNPSARLDTKGIAIEYFLGLSAEKASREFVGGSEKFLEGFVSLLKDDHKDIVNKSYHTLINLATEEAIALKLLNLKNCSNLTDDLVNLVLDCNNEHADETCKLLSNLTRFEGCARKVAEAVLQKDRTVKEFVSVLCNLNYNKHGKMHHLAAIMGNLTQVRDIREVIMSRSEFVVQNLLPFIKYEQSSVRRHGIATLLKNCCFDSEHHEWLLSDQVDLLPYLLLPLAGPEEFDEEDTDKLPEDLQYLPPDKTREREPEIRRILMETIFRLCSTKKGRQYVKDKNTYVIMREFHKWEEDRNNFPAMMNLIDLLIGDEPESGMENLEEIDIPADIKEKFKKMDEEDAKDLSKDDNDGDNQ